MSQPYENIYELNEDEVHFLNAAEEMSTENRSVWGCMRLGLAACDSAYVYMMPAGVQFHSEWLRALDFMDQDEELKAFFLDPNLTQGGFFRKPFLDSFLQSSEASGLMSDESDESDESDVECFWNLVTLMQEADLPCGLLEFEFEDEDPEEPAEYPDDQPEVNPVSDEEMGLNSEPEMEPNSSPEPELKPEIQAEAGTELASGSEADWEVGAWPQTDPESESEIEAQSEPALTTFSSAKPGIWTNICAMLRRFFKSGNF